MDRAKGIGALIVVLAGGSLLVTMLTFIPPADAIAVETPWVGPWLWEVRGLDMVVQALLILAGVLGVLLILGDSREKG